MVAGEKGREVAAGQTEKNKPITAWDLAQLHCVASANRKAVPEVCKFRSKPTKDGETLVLSVSGRDLDK